MVEKVRTIEEVDRYILGLQEDIQEITVALRKIILQTSPNLIEEFKWSMPNYSYNGLVCYLQAAKKHVNLGFHKGYELEVKDTNNLLQGQGKALRYFRIKKMEEIQPDIFTDLIKEAMALNEK
ncbi:hypothetical protein SAMN05877753_10330 [Bacillus oleivorans]|uniref:YdhG-like domain-containing protein n=1 Tax=Bacillus oleivorans TaxID=1448271 RepID=A0A285CPB5_9BACI|nr:DUF1801 domain-containing protein [Bacillus oleivorans]SNX69392.1 hypothetical protein SAMN05877753_10330 [Bacillus oleivorans]